MDTTDAAAAMRVPAPRIIMVPPSSSVAMAKYAAAAAMGMPICSKEATVPAGVHSNAFWMPCIIMTKPKTRRRISRPVDFMVSLFTPLSLIGKVLHLK